MFEQQKFEELELLKLKISIPQDIDKELVLKVYSNMMEWLIYENTIDNFEEGFLRLIGIYDDVITIVGRKEMSDISSQDVWKKRLRIK